MKGPVLMNALHLATIFANSRGMLNTPKETNQIIMKDSQTQDWFKSDMTERQAIVEKYRAKISTDLHPIEIAIRSAFRVSGAEQLKDIVRENKETVALVLSFYMAMCQNQKQLWLHIEEHNHIAMRRDLIDREISTIQELALNYQLNLQ